MDSSQVVSYTIISDSHYHGCRTEEFIKSFKHFHPDIELVIFGQKEIDREFSKTPGLNFYNAKAHFAKLLYNDYELVVNIDSDHLVLSRMEEILKSDYEVACPANWNISCNVSIGVTSGVKEQHRVTIVPEQYFYQGGLIASTSKAFWDAYDFASKKQYQNFACAENDVLNVLLFFNDYKVKYLERHWDFNHKDFTCYYGCSSLGREKQAVINNNQIELDGKPMRAYHFAYGGINKRPVKDIFSQEVTDFIYSKIVI